MSTALVGGLRKHLMERNSETFEQTINTDRTIESILIEISTVRDDSSDNYSFNTIRKHSNPATNVNRKVSCASCGSTDHIDQRPNLDPNG
jgi:hypothetical protein